MSEGKFEAKTGLSNGAVSNFGEGLNNKTLDKILAVYPQLNKIWLLHGEGEMLLTPKKKELAYSAFTLKTGMSGLNEDDHPYDNTLPRLLSMLEKAHDTILSQQKTILVLTERDVGLTKNA